MRVTNRVFQFIALGMIAASPALAQGGMAGMKHDDADKKVEGGGKLPAGWAARTDRDAPVSGVKFVKMGEGWHVTSGPAAVYYREADKASGNYKVSATFSAGKGQYPEGYGLVIGGSDLAGANQQYTYDFDGVSEVLDHILITKGIGTFTYQVVHVNAEFADQVSDHDPQVVDIKP